MTLALALKHHLHLGVFTLSSGRRKAYYLDVKGAMMDSYVLNEAATAVSWKLPNEEIAHRIAVGGMEIGAVPLTAALLMYRPALSGFIIRKTEPEHGLRSRLIGEVAERRCVVLEDVTTTGGSALEAVKLVRKHGGICDRVVSVVDMQEDASSRLRDAGVTLMPILSISQVLAAG